LWTWPTVRLSTDTVNVSTFNGDILTSYKWS
jgi:hypothetical protein